MDDAVREVRDAVAAGGEVLRLLLHPYLRWTTADGRAIRGRTNVLAHLADAEPPAVPLTYELRDGQVYRWTEPPAPS